jgi:hypothetical protein
MLFNWFKPMLAGMRPDTPASAGQGMTVPDRNPLQLQRLLTHPWRYTRLLEFFFRRKDTAGDIYPNDDSTGTVPGPDPDRVVFLGEPGELTLGVRTHELSLSAFYARQHSQRTGRGTIWSIAPIRTALLRDGPKTIGGNRSFFGRADIVVLLAGITDTLTVTTAATWEKHLRATLDALTEKTPANVRILVGEIPPLDNAGTLSKPARMAAGVHGKTLNSRTRTVVAEYPHVSVVTFPPELTHSVWRPESEERRYTTTYKIWGKQLAENTSIHG